jgi:hypothetical protein
MLSKGLLTPLNSVNYTETNNSHQTSTTRTTTFHIHHNSLAATEIVETTD